MRVLTTLFSLLPLLCVLPACESIESADLDTSGIWADIDVMHDGDGTLAVSAELRSGGRRSNTWLQLTDGDQLHARIDDGDAQRMRGEELLSRFWYNTHFDSAPDDALVTVAFSRVEKDDAPESQVRLPLGFEMTGPRAGQRFGSGDTIAVTWSNESSDRFKLEATGDCIESFEKTVEDNGRFALSADGFTRRGDDPGCTVAIKASRIRGGRVDSAFKGGEVRAQQVRTVRFELVLPTVEPVDDDA